MNKLTIALILVMGIYTEDYLYYVEDFGHPA